MKHKIRIEHREGNVWKAVKVEYGLSRNMNHYAKYHDADGKEHVLVWKLMKMGEPVLEKTSDDHVPQGWVKVGRIDRSINIFLGEGESYADYLYSPKGMEDGRKMLAQIRAENEARLKARSMKTEEKVLIKKYEFPDLLNGGV